LTDIFIQWPLYRYEEIGEDDYAKLQMLIGLGAGQIDCFCIGCGKDSIFSDRRTSRWTPEDAMEDRVFSTVLACRRDSKHQYAFFFEMEGRKLRKIGQSPSHADLANAELNRFRPILGNPRSAELRRAVGLAANGVGVGAYVYLRRIFESLLEEHRLIHEAAHGPIPDWASRRIQERVTAIAATLPPALVTNKAIYAIMSKGIHELEEQECLAYFDVLKQAIILILEQDEAARARREQEVALAKAVQTIQSALGNGPTAAPS
jgi:hypothetical protein